MTTWYAKQSGYLVAATEITWASGQSLNSLTNDEYTILSDEIDNSSDLNESVDLYIVLASAAFTGADSGIEVFLILSVNGTNYPTWTGDGTADKQENFPHRVGFAPTTGTTAAQALTVRNIELPPGKFKWAFRNRSNALLASSGNTAYWRPHGHISTDV